MFSSVASIFSLAVVGVLRFHLFSMKFFVSSENLLFLLVLLFHFLPAPISGSVMLLSYRLRRCCCCYHYVVLLEPHIDFVDLF